MGTEWPTIVLSFIGTLIALAITKTFERWHTKAFEQSECSRDLLIHLANHLPAIERFIAELSKEFIAPGPEALRAYPSEFVWSRLPLALDKLLAAFPDPAVHRLLLDFFDRDELFRDASNEGRDAYFWLLDTSAAWDQESAKERVGAIGASRERMLTYAREMLKNGYALIETLLPLSGKFPANLMRGSAAEFAAFLLSTYAIDAKEARRRRLFYSAVYPDRAQTSFDPEDAYPEVRFDVSSLEQPASFGVILRLVLPGQVETLRVRVSPIEEAALPEECTIAGVETIGGTADEAGSGDLNFRPFVLKRRPNGEPTVVRLPAPKKLVR